MGKIEIRRQFLATFCGTYCSVCTIIVCNRIDMKKKKCQITIFVHAANVLALSFGQTMVWAPSNYLVLQTNETRLPSGPLTADEASMVASIFAIGGLVGNMSFLWIVERFGRKMPLLLLAIPQMVRISFGDYMKSNRETSFSLRSALHR